MLPSDATERKNVPICTGVLDYFPDALAEVARTSKAGNDQHNPGQPMHWDKSKSTDEADCIVRHLAQRGTVDSDGIRHSAKVAWRALALLQREIEAEQVQPCAREWEHKFEPKLSWLEQNEPFPVNSLVRARTVGSKSTVLGHVVSYPGRGIIVVSGPRNNVAWDTADWYCVLSTAELAK